MAKEVKGIVDDGVTYVQVDAPGYSRFIVPERLKEQVLDRGLDPENGARDRARRRERTAARGQARRRDGRGAHLPRHLHPGTPGPLGAAASSYAAPTIGRIIDRLEADTFLIEYSGRSGSLKSLRDVPKHKTISLGLINIRDPRVETMDE